MIVWLSIVALISAAITIYAKRRENNFLQYVFKPLTMAAIILTAILQFAAPPTVYQKWIITGLIFSTVGDVFLINPRRFVQGLLSFLLAHVCFAAAFFSVLNFPSAIFYLAYVAFFLAVLWKNLGRLKIPVVVYSSALAAMAWFAASRYFELQDAESFHAFCGANLFVASDSLLAFNKFKRSFSLAHSLILGTYFVAQWLIALSV